MGFIKGVDISSLPELEDLGLALVNKAGQSCDGFEMCKESGVNSVRLRIWNDPSSVPDAKGYCDLEHTVAMAKRIKKAGMHFLLDFHYSDFWADPGQQRKPHEWENYSFEELKQAVYDFTTMVLERLRGEGCMPDMVQVGNEIRSGMLFPEGEVPNYDNLAQLLNAGIAAVRKADPSIVIMIHLDQGGRFYYLKEWFDNTMAAGLSDFDVIGVSYYPFWHGTYLDLKKSLESLIERYHRPVYIAETAHPWRRTKDGFVTEEQERIAGFPAGIDTQKEVMELVMNLAASIPNEMCGGVYYWEPIATSTVGGGGWNNNMGMIDLDGKAFPAFDVFKFERKDYDPAKIQRIYEPNPLRNTNLTVPNGINLVKNVAFDDGERHWSIKVAREDVDLCLVPKEEMLSFSSRKNFRMQIQQEIYVAEPGKYSIGVFYRGTNTTGVEVLLVGDQMQRETSVHRELVIYPSDEEWGRYEIQGMEFEEGMVSIGLSITAPPVEGKVKWFWLCKEE